MKHKLLTEKEFIMSLEQAVGGEHNGTPSGAEVAGKKLGVKAQFNHEDSQVLNGLEPGSPQAKAMWAKVDASAHSPEAIAKAKAAGCSNATGWYDGKPLAPGMGAEHSQHDWQMNVDKLHYANGLDWVVAKKIASQAMQNTPK